MTQNHEYYTIILNEYRLFSEQKRKKEADENTRVSYFKSDYSRRKQSA